MSRAVLVTGATGSQGGAVVSALASASSDLTILAVTRNPDSPSAQKLLSQSANIKLVKGDFSDVPAMFTAAKAIHPNIWGVYSVQTVSDTTTEVTQGKAMIDSALAHNVKQFVYSSVERGGDGSASYDNETDIPHFMTKYTIEHHLVDSAKGTDMLYAILRPVAFMDNFKQGFGTKVFVAALKTVMPVDKKLQWVDVRDIGYFAAQALLHPEQWRDRSISIAGDDLTVDELDKVFRNVAGVPLPSTFSPLGYALRAFVYDFRKMLNFMAEASFGADIAALKKEHPGLRSFGDWIRDNKALFV
ncbi:hypothetical protein ANO11243_068910 [Dothideomycetidae sp. 11243]|nr:hypothetical protein ANO11243_068910 [fungal sp. No.11243]